MLHSVDLSDYMVQGPITILAEADLFDAIHMIIDNRISGICVVDEHDDLVGLLSEIDCLRAILAVTYNEHGDVGKVGDYMTKEVDYCDLHADLVDIADDMVKKRPSSSSGTGSWQAGWSGDVSTAIASGQ